MQLITPQLINPLLLPSIPLEQSKNLPSSPGIYFAIDADNNIQYIGLASNLKARWSNHHKKAELTQAGKFRLPQTWQEMQEEVAQYVRVLSLSANPMPRRQGLVG